MAKKKLEVGDDQTTLDLFAEAFDQPQLTKHNVAEHIRSERILEPEPKLTLLSFGGGQDSWAILLKIIYDDDFKKEYAPHDLVVIMSDTGNEHPYTLDWNRKAEKLCKQNDIPFFFLEAGDMWHTAGWTDLKSNMRRNRTIFGASMQQKSCTSSLKIQPIDKFLTDYMSELYGFRVTTRLKPQKNKGQKDLFMENVDLPDNDVWEFTDKSKAWATYEQVFKCKARVLIGFAKDEEARVLNSLKIKTKLPAWKQNHIQFCYPLVEQGWNRKSAQKIIRSYLKEVVPPSNCMLCFYQSNEEIVWLERNYPEEFAEWVELENSKLTKASNVKMGNKNYGVYAEITLPEKLEQAKQSVNTKWKDGALSHKTIGEWTDDELWEYKMSHGHCVKSVY